MPVSREMLEWIKELWRRIYSVLHPASLQDDCPSHLYEFPRTDRSFPAYHEVRVQGTIRCGSSWISLWIITEKRNSLNINLHIFCEVINRCYTDLRHDKRNLSPVNSSNSYNSVQSKQKTRVECRKSPTDCWLNGQTLYNSSILGRQQNQH